MYICIYIYSWKCLRSSSVNLKVLLIHYVSCTTFICFFFVLVFFCFSLFGCFCFNFLCLLRFEVLPYCFRFCVSWKTLTMGKVNFFCLNVWCANICTCMNDHKWNYMYVCISYTLFKGGTTQNYPFATKREKLFLAHVNHIGKGEFTLDFFNEL